MASENIQFPTAADGTGYDRDAVDRFISEQQKKLERASRAPVAKDGVHQSTDILTNAHNVSKKYINDAQTRAASIIKEAEEKAEEIVAKADKEAAELPAKLEKMKADAQAEADKILSSAKNKEERANQNATQIIEGAQELADKLTKESEEKARNGLTAAKNRAEEILGSAKELAEKTTNEANEHATEVKTKAEEEARAVAAKARGVYDNVLAKKHEIESSLNDKTNRLAAFYAQQAKEVATLLLDVEPVNPSSVAEQEKSEPVETPLITPVLNAVHATPISEVVAPPTPGSHLSADEDAPAALSPSKATENSSSDDEYSGPVVPPSGGLTLALAEDD